MPDWYGAADSLRRFAEQLPPGPGAGKGRGVTKPHLRRGKRRKR